MKRTDAEKLVSAAVQAAMEACMTGIDDKLQEAINLGVTIGAKAGAEVGAAAAVKAIEREKRKYSERQHDKRLYNVKLLIQNYRILNASYKEAVFDANTAKEEDEDFETIMQSFDSFSEEDLIVESIMKNRLKTRIIMIDVNKNLRIYQSMCEQSKSEDDKRRWRTLYDMYISDEPVKAEDIAKRESINKRTVYKDIDICVADLTKLLYGVEGIRKLKRN